MQQVRRLSETRQPDLRSQRHAWLKCFVCQQLGRLSIYLGFSTSTAVPPMRRRSAGLRRLLGSCGLHTGACRGPSMPSTGLPASLASAPSAAAAPPPHRSFASVVRGRKASPCYDAAASHGAAAAAASLRSCGAESGASMQRRATSYARALCGGGSASCTLPEAGELARPASTLSAAAAEFVPVAGVALQGRGGLFGSGWRAGCEPTRGVARLVQLASASELLLCCLPCALSVLVRFLVYKTSGRNTASDAPAESNELRVLRQEAAQPKGSRRVARAAAAAPRSRGAGARRPGAPVLCNDCAPAAGDRGPQPALVCRGSGLCGRRQLVGQGAAGRCKGRKPCRAGLRD